MYQLFVGFMAEGNTDYKFLMPIIEKTINDIAFNEIESEVEISVFEVENKKRGGFNNHVFEASKNGFSQFGIMWLIVHTDADNATSKAVYEFKINPAIEFLRTNSEKEICKNLIPLAPIYETESWMLANKDLIKRQIGTNKSDEDLGINGHPESFNKPKEKIEEAIRIGRQDLSSKIRSKISILDLYSIIGQSLSIQDLEKFRSYVEFQNNIRIAMREMNLIN